MQSSKALKPIFSLGSQFEQAGGHNDQHQAHFCERTYGHQRRLELKIGLSIGFCIKKRRTVRAKPKSIEFVR
jgi:hypothetical protein